MFLAACSENQTANSTGQGGEFTNAVLKALSNGKKAASEVMNKAKVECTGQTPHLYSYKIKKDLVIY